MDFFSNGYLRPTYVRFECILCRYSLQQHRTQGATAGVPACIDRPRNGNHCTAKHNDPGDEDSSDEELVDAHTPRPCSISTTSHNDGDASSGGEASSSMVSAIYRVDDAFWSLRTVVVRGQWQDRSFVDGLDTKRTYHVVTLCVLK